MPIYEYMCSACGDRQELIRPVRFRNDPRRCSCGKGILRRVASVPARNHPGRPAAPLPVEASKALPPGRAHRPNLYMENVKVVNCGTAVKIEGPHHLEGRNIEIVGTPTGFDLSGGATVDLKNVKFNPRERKTNR